MRFCLLAGLVLLMGCASPDVRRPQKLVSDKELLAIALVREGSTNFAQSRFMDAEIKFRQALYLYPDAQNIQRDLAISLGKLGFLSEAEQLLARLPNEASQITLLKAAMYYENGELAKARAAYMQALGDLLTNNKTQQALDVTRSLAVLEFLQGHEEEALCYSYSAFALANPGVSSPTVLDEGVRHAKLLLALGAVRSSQEFATKLIDPKVTQGDARVYFNLALTNYALGDVKNAINNVVKSKESGATDRGLDAQLNLLNFLAKKADTSEDRKDSQQASEEDNLESLHAQALEVAQQALALYLPLEVLDDLKSFIDGYTDT